MKYIVLVLLVMMAVLQTGCTKEAHLYNVTSGKMTPIKYSTNHKVVATLESGEVLNGEWSAVQSGTIGWGNIYSSVYSPGGTASGSGSATAVSVGGSRGTAFLTGNKGTIMQCEFMAGFSGRGNGACTDNHDQKYKLMF